MIQLMFQPKVGSSWILALRFAKNSDVAVYLGKFDHDLTILLNPGIIVDKRNHPQMAQQFRLVTYSNLPRYIAHKEPNQVAGPAKLAS